PGSLFGGQGKVQDPKTGQWVTPTQPWATVLNSTLLVNDIPAFYFPYASGTPEDITTPLQTISFQQDRIFGTQLLTKWDAFSLLGLNRPEGVRWYADFNYLSQRGPMAGTDVNYEGVDPWGNPYQGVGLASFVNDGGTDNLGLDRRSL